MNVKRLICSANMLTSTILSVLALSVGASASGSLSFGSSASSRNSLSLPKDSSGRPDYCVITSKHTACNRKSVSVASP